MFTRKNERVAVFLFIFQSRENINKNPSHQFYMVGICLLELDVFMKKWTKKKGKKKV